MKQCKDCNKIKPLSLFPLRSSSRDGYRNNCKACKYARQRVWEKNNIHKIRAYQSTDKFKSENRIRHVRRAFGLTKVEYEKMLYDQGYKCAICRVPEIELKDRLCVDHDHETSKNRALLCHRCNRSLGLMRDQSKIVLSAYQYLVKHGR